MSQTVDVVEFDLGGELYALDIQLAREIVEMMPITPIPRAPPYLSGIINLRGEITTILDLANLLGMVGKKELNGQKIIVLVPEAAGGVNIGVIVDEVHSVIQVPEGHIEKLGEGISSDFSEFVKGIIKISLEDGDKIQKTSKEDHKKKSLVIWIDILKVMKDLVVPRSPSVANT
jgi:purine-binding chemotaxis protein CheW